MLEINLENVKVKHGDCYQGSQVYLQPIITFKALNLCKGHLRPLCTPNGKIWRLQKSQNGPKLQEFVNDNGFNISMLDDMGVMSDNTPRVR